MPALKTTDQHAWSIPCSGYHILQPPCRTGRLSTQSIYVRSSVSNRAGYATEKSASAVFFRGAQRARKKSESVLGSREFPIVTMRERSGDTSVATPCCPAGYADPGCLAGKERRPCDSARSILLRRPGRLLPSHMVVPVSRDARVLWMYGNRIHKTVIWSLEGRRGASDGTWMATTQPHPGRRCARQRPRK